MLTHKGTKREFFKDVRGEFPDINEYAIIRNEWEEFKKSAE